jgi:hypothetical protein
MIEFFEAEYLCLGYLSLRPILNQQNTPPDYYIMRLSIQGSDTPHDCNNILQCNDI